MPVNAQELVQLGGTVVVVAFFIWYLNKRDKINDEKDKRWAQTLNHYLRDSLNVKKDLAVKLQRNTDVLENLEAIIEKDIAKRTSKINGKVRGDIKAEVLT